MNAQELYYEAFAPDPFEAYYNESLPGRDAPKTHFHPGYEAILFASPGVVVIVNGRIYEAQEGDVLLVNNQDIHQLIAPQHKPFRRFVFAFSAACIASFCTERTNLFRCFSHAPAEATLVHLSAGQRTGLEQYYHQLAGGDSSQAYGGDVRRRLLLGALLLDLNEWARSTVEGARRGSDNLTQQLLMYIHQNIASDLSLETLSAQFYLNKNHLNNQFKGQVGITLHQYIVLSRITYAKHCLRLGMSVADTAQESGFGSAANFVRAFKRMTGAPPMHYLRAERQQRPPGQTLPNMLYQSSHYCEERKP